MYVTISIFVIFVLRTKKDLHVKGLAHILPIKQYMSVYAVPIRVKHLK